MKVGELNQKRTKPNANKDGCNKMLKVVILQQVNVVSLLLLQILATVENY